MLVSLEKWPIRGTAGPTHWPVVQHGPKPGFDDLRVSKFQPPSVLRLANQPQQRDNFLPELVLHDPVSSCKR
jgi:hypothetical protein